MSELIKTIGWVAGTVGVVGIATGLYALNLKGKKIIQKEKKELEEKLLEIISSQVSSVTKVDENEILSALNNNNNPKVLEDLLKAELIIEELPNKQYGLQVLSLISVSNGAKKLTAELPERDWEDLPEFARDKLIKGKSTLIISIFKKKEDK